MKIALCLHGVVGNLYHDKDNYQWREDVDYRIGLEHYQRHFFAPNGEVDVFVHSWSTRYEDEIVRDYAPQAHVFQEQIDFEHGETRLNFLESRWYSLKAAVELKRRHERDRGFVYDWVMLSRFDLALHKHVDLAKHDPTRFYAAQHDFRPRASGEPPPGSATNNGFCDLFFHCNSENADRFGALHDVWRDYGIFDAHLEAYAHTQALGLTVDHRLIRGPDFELVRGVYENCQYTGEDYAGAATLKRTDWRVGRFSDGL